MGGEGPRRPPSPRLALPLALAKELPGCDGRGQESIGGLGLGWKGIMGWDGWDAKMAKQSQQAGKAKVKKTPPACMDES